MLCTSVYDARLVIDYTDNGQTALCPICGLDSVVGDACGIIIDETSISMLNDKFCGGYRIPKGKKYRNIIVK
jgi:hypothetical protein